MFPVQFTSSLHTLQCIYKVTFHFLFDINIIIKN